MQYNLLPLRPNPHILIIDLNMNDVWTAAYRAVLDVLLACTSREVDGYNNLLPASFANVTGFIVHAFIVVNEVR